LQFGGAVTASVGAIVTAGVGVNVAGTKDCFVGAKVAVTKLGWAGGAMFESTATEIQDVREASRTKVKSIFFIMDF
jgi:hypothetical protein